MKPAFILVESSAIAEIQHALLEIKNQLHTREAIHSPEEVLDNDTFCKLLSISKRTAQKYRDSGQIAYTQIGKKIYYKRADLDVFLMSHRRKAFTR